MNPTAEHPTVADATLPEIAVKEPVSNQVKGGVSSILNGHTNGKLDAHANGTAASAKPKSSAEAFTIKNDPVENLRPIKVRVIGAGFSGILAAIRIPERMRNVDLVVYEKNPELGGVWYLNKYPGLACDIPSHSYQYTFAPNPHWSSLYAPGAEIQQYLKNVAERFGATRYIQTQRKLIQARWIEETKKWTLKMQKTDTGEFFEENDIDFLMPARGQLNEVAWPELPGGLETFQGKILHSAEWDEDYDFTNKTIGVIGNGSSAIQIVPKLQKVRGTTMTVFMRSPTWISASFGDAAMVALGQDPNDIEFGLDKRAAFASDPEGYLKMRKVIEDGGNLIHDSTIPGTKMLAEMTEEFQTSMKQRLSKKPELHKNIIPTFAPGCRRLTPGRGYLEALTEDNITVINDTIAGVTPKGLKLADGREIHMDALVCATGFKTSAPPNFNVIGKNGLTLAQRWAERPESYLSIMCDGFPNYLMMFGPNSAIGFGSLTKILEQECDYCVKILRKMQKDDYATIEPKPARVKDFTEYIDAYFANTVYLDKCKSWYRSDGGKGDKIIGLWPGSTLHGLEAMRSPRWEDFDYESRDTTGNMLRWLGNGWSVTQTEGDPSWYLNANEVDVPVEGKPEENPKHLARPWSY